MCFKIYFNIHLIIVIYFMNFMNFDFIFIFFLLYHTKIYTIKLIVTWNFSLSRHDIASCIFSSFFKGAAKFNCNCNLNQRFKLLFFKISLDFGTSDYISTYGKLNLLPINSIFLTFSSREMQKRLTQTKVYYKLFCFVSKEASRSSYPEKFLGKGVLKICSKFTGEHPCWSVILITLLCNFTEIALQHWCCFSIGVALLWVAASECLRNLW